MKNATMDKLFKGIDYLTGILTGLMVLFVFMNVVLRTCFNSGLTWSEELSRYLFVFVTYVGAISAMRVNGLPTLACKAFLGPLGQTVTLEPLSKFPLVADLVVDRGVIFEQLKKIHLWLSGAAVTREKTHELRFQSSRCLMCGCCLEICPNFRAGGGFAGALAAVGAYRMFNQESDEAHRAEAAKRYVASYYSGCGTSLACRAICPAGIPVDELVSRSNAAAVWRRRS